MNYGQLARAIETIGDISDGNLKDETPVKVFIGGKFYKEVTAIYPEDIAGEIVVIIEA